MSDYSDRALRDRAETDKSVRRALEVLLATPEALRVDVFAEANFTRNMTGVRPSEALQMAALTVRAHGGRP